jgi:hypothetical protein
MIEPGILITNNKMVSDKMGGRFDVVFVEGMLIDVLKLVRDYIHKGYRLLTHPLMGSIKPNETPFKTVLISKANGETIDVESLTLIENSIASAEKFLKMRGTPCWTQKIMDDFRLIDYDLISNAIN